MQKEAQSYRRNLKLELKIKSCLAFVVEFTQSSYQGINVVIKVSEVERE